MPWVRMAAIANSAGEGTIAAMLKRVTLSLVLLAASAFACSFLPPTYKVPRSFSVHVTNEVGPVVGLKLRVFCVKSDVAEKLTSEQVRSIDPNSLLETIAESVTDSSGNARFSLDRVGGFTLEPDSPAGHLDWVGLEVSDEQTSSVVALKWPTSAILKASHLRGRLTTGLMSSRSSPLKSDTLTLRSLVEYREIASTTTTQDGKFEFGDIAPGLYFIHLAPAPTKADPNYYEGDIAVYLASNEPRESLAISTMYSSCGLGYDLEENKDRYKPAACLKGDQQVACDY